MKTTVNADATTDSTWSVPARARPAPDPTTPITDLSTMSFTCRNLGRTH